MESEANGKETVTFSTVTKSTSRPEEKEKDRKEGRRRIKPAKAKRDRERREAWLERRKTGVGKSVADVPAVSLVTEPAPKTPEGTCRTMVTGSTPEEAEWRRPVEEPLASPEHTAVLDMDSIQFNSNQLLLLTQQLVSGSRSSLQQQVISRTEKEITTAELPATAPVSAPTPATVPRTPDGTWRVRESSPQGGGPRRGYSPMDGYFGSFRGGFRGDRRAREIRAPFRRGYWIGRKTPPSWIKVVFVLF